MAGAGVKAPPYALDAQLAAYAQQSLRTHSNGGEAPSTHPVWIDLNYSERTLID